MMRQQILVLGSISADSQESEALRKMCGFVEGAIGNAARDMDVYFCHADELGFVTTNDMAFIHDFRNGKELKEYKMVFFRGKLLPAINEVSLVSSFLQKYDIPCVNSAYAGRRAAGKVPQMFQLRDLGLPIT